jgi:hypothetical protein
MTEKSNWKVVTLVIGGLIGLLSGLAGAYLVIRQQEKTGQPLKLTSGEGARIGMGILALLKQVSETGKLK